MSKKKKMTNCFVTKNYSQFKKTKGNRPINPSHVSKIKKAMTQQYGSKKGEQVFYASANKGVITGVEKRNKGGLIKGLPKLTKIL